MARIALAKNNFCGGSFVAEVVAHGTASRCLSASKPNQGFPMHRLSLGTYSPFVIIVGIICLTIFGVSLACAQHNHSAGHDEYKNWVSKDGSLCCNKSDCGQIAVEDERWQDGKLEIKIEQKWCPVKPGMYLKTGKSPDWQVSHACVWPDWSGDQDVCSRLKCYQGKGGV